MVASGRCKTIVKTIVFALDDTGLLVKTTVFAFGDTGLLVKTTVFALGDVGLLETTTVFAPPRPSNVPEAAQVGFKQKFN